MVCIVEVEVEDGNSDYYCTVTHWLSADLGADFSV
jgi:hypothetical protein